MSASSHMVCVASREQSLVQGQEKKMKKKQHKTKTGISSVFSGSLTGSLFLVLWLNRGDFFGGFCFIHSLCSSMTQATTLGTKPTDKGDFLKRHKTVNSLLHGRNANLPAISICFFCFFYF